MFMTQNLNVETFWMFEFTVLNRGKFKTSKSIVEDDKIYSLFLKKYLKLENICQFLEGSLGW